MSVRLCIGCLNTGYNLCEVKGISNKLEVGNNGRF